MGANPVAKIVNIINGMVVFYLYNNYIYKIKIASYGAIFYTERILVSE